MKRTVKDNRQNAPTPVQQVEVSEKNTKIKVVLFVVFLAIALACLAVFVNSFFSVDEGWTIVKTDFSQENNCGEFVFSYYFSKADNKEYRRELASAYSSANEVAFKLFDDERPYQGFNNVYYINQHPNEEISVSPFLYKAFEMMLLDMDEYLYLAPVYELYDNMFLALSDDGARPFDPYTNEKISKFCNSVIEYVKDGDIKIELSGENKIRLNVSDHYMDFIRRNECKNYIDFFWFRNAFIIDYVADALIGKQYTKGVISCFDGFTRNLDDGGNVYATNIFDKVGREVFIAGQLKYSKKIAMVSFKNYEISARDAEYFHTYENGDCRSCFIDVESGKNKSSIPNLTVYSTTKSCAETAASAYNVYVSDSPLSDADVSGLYEKGIFSVYCVGDKIKYNDDTIEIFAEKYDDKVYSAEFIK